MIMIQPALQVRGQIGFGQSEYPLIQINNKAAREPIISSSSVIYSIK